MKDIYIADLARLLDEKQFENKPFDSIYLVLSKQQRTTRAAKPYLSLILGDNSGQIDAKVWELADPRIASDFNRGDAIKVRGSVSKFDGNLQLKIDLLKRLSPGDYDRTDLLPATTYDIDELWAQLAAIVASFTEPDLKRLVTAVLDDAEVRAAFREAPAAKQLHHAFLGGLLEHVVSLLTLADKVVPHYPILMRDLVLTGVILHDIGKIHELSWSTGFEYTLEGTLLGHIQIGASMVEQDDQQPARLSAAAQDAGAAHDPLASRQAGVRLAQAAHDSGSADAQLPRRHGRQDANAEVGVRESHTRPAKGRAR